MARQSSALPTNKLAVGTTVTAIIGTQAAPLVTEIWPQVAPAMLAGPVMTETLGMLVALIGGLIVGWFVPDRPNVA